MLFPRFRQILLVIVMFGIWTSCFAGAIETQLSQDQIVLGDSVTITYITNDRNINGLPNFSVLQKDFRIISTNSGTAINMINGVTTSQSFWRLQLQPTHAGELIIPEVSFGSDKSLAMKLSVKTSPAIQAAQTTSVKMKQDSPVFVRGEVSTNSPYVESFVIYKFKLYFRTQLREPRVDMPQVKGATFLQLNDVPAYQTIINGKTYNVIEKHFAIFPQNPGTMTISPMQFQGLAVDDNVSPYDDPYNFDIPKPVSAATNAFNLNVRDIPAAYQGKVWLPAKNITLSEIWSDNTSRLDAGTPITRTIKITAQGLRADQLPDLTFPKIDGVNVYADRPKRDNQMTDNMVTGTYEQQVTYIPSQTASFMIPAIQLPWWNTDTNANATATLNEKSFQVNISAAQLNTTTAKPLPAQTTTQPAVITKPFYLSIWFWVTCFMSLAWIITMFLLFRKKNPAANQIAVIQHSVGDAISDKAFAAACKNGEAIQAQQYLLQWAKNNWPDESPTLTSLRAMIKDESFVRELQELESSLYARNKTTWKGENLLSVFKQIKIKHLSSQKEQSKHGKKPNRHTDPLPPLFPE